MKIKKSQLATRTVKAKLTFEEGGERRTEEFRVVYKSMSPALTRELQQAQMDDNKRGFSEAMAVLVVSIPDIVEDDDTPIQINADVLDEFGWDNLNAINDAITADCNPKQQPSDASPATS